MQSEVNKVRLISRLGKGARRTAMLATLSLVSAGVLSGYMAYSRGGEERESLQLRSTMLESDERPLLAGHPRPSRVPVQAPVGNELDLDHENDTDDAPGLAVAGGAQTAGYESSAWRGADGAGLGSRPDTPGSNFRELSSSGEADESEAGDDFANLPTGTSRVLHITNVGDRILVSESTGDTGAIERANRPVSFHDAAPMPEDRPSEGAPAADVSARRPDYEDRYPGCPGVLPPGSGEEMAAERLALYGCLYYAVCSLASDTDPVSCTWYLNKKV
jgi:hypothetical protein